MNIRTTALCIALVPALALLGACKKDASGDDMAPAASTAPAPAATAPADENTPAASMSPDGTDTSAMPSDDMSTDGAPAQDTGAMATDEGKTFAELDKNHDGGISKDELAPTDMLYQHFSVADADGNGVLSEAEVSKHRAAMSAVPAQ